MKSKATDWRKYFKSYVFECGDGLMSVNQKQTYQTVYFIYVHPLCINSSSISLLENYYKGMKFSVLELSGWVGWITTPWLFGYFWSQNTEPRILKLSQILAREDHFSFKPHSVFLLVPKCAKLLSAPSSSCRSPQRA